MSNSRLNAQRERHAKLEEKISELSRSPAADSLQISGLKRQKLQIKEEIEKLQSEAAS